MSKLINKKIALVTGANKGLGYETARQLAKLGIKVLIGARDEERGTEAAGKLLKEGLEAEFIRLDLDNPKTHQLAAKYVEETYGRLDILINNAAINLEYDPKVGPKALPMPPIEIFRKTFETNFFNLIEVTQAFLSLIKKSEAGRIVNLSSGLGSTTMHADLHSPIYDFKTPAYDASKTAVNSYTVHLAYELKDTPIKVNAADPGWVKTDMGGDNALLEIEDGVKTSIALATLPADGYSGKFIHLDDELPW